MVRAETVLKIFERICSKDRILLLVLNHRSKQIGGICGNFLFISILPFFSYSPNILISFLNHSVSSVNCKRAVERHNL